MHIIQNPVAVAIPFDNSTDGWVATNVQAAIEEAPLHLRSIEVSATADATTTSGTQALLTTMTVTPSAGTYLVWFSTSVVSNGTNCTSTFGLYVGGTLKADSSRTNQPYDGGTLAATTATAGVAINGIVTVNGSQAVEIHWSTAGGTATCHQRTLNLLRVT